MQKGPKPLSAYRNIRNIRWADPPESKKPEDKPAEPIEPPDWLDSDAAKLFRCKAMQIQAAGYWSPLFEDALALLSCLLAEHQRNPSGLSAAKLCQMRLLLSECGLTPASRRGVDLRRGGM